MFENIVIALRRLENEIKNFLFNTVSELPFTLDKIRIEAKKEDFIVKIKNPVTSAGNKYKRNTTENHTFSICDDVLEYAEKVLIRKRILKDFRIGHSGMSRMKSLTRSFVHWPGMDHEIKLLLKNCIGWASAGKSTPIKFKSWPWKRLHIDFARALNGSYYFIIVDSFSKWLEILKCKRQTSISLVNFLNEIFSRFRVPETTVSNSATQFPSSEFAKCCQFYSIEHISTPAYYSRSNGQVEMFVDSFKRGLKRINGEQNEVVSLQQFLRIHRMTPNPNTQSGLSLAELMFGRKVRSIYDKLLPGRKINVWKNTKQMSNRYFKHGDRFFFRLYISG